MDKVDYFTFPVRFLKGIGPAREKLFQKLGIDNLKDLFYYFPFRYEDRRNVSLISSLKPGETAVVKALVKSIRVSRGFYRVKHRVEAVLEDESGAVLSVWFNQPYIANYIKPGRRFIIFGKLRFYNRHLAFVCPEFEPLDSGQEFNVKRIVPVYNLTSGLTQKAVRRVIFNSLKKYVRFVIEPIPYTIREEEQIPNIAESLVNIHFPKDMDWLKNARQRFIFEDFFISQVLVYLRKLKFRTAKKTKISLDYKYLEGLEKSLSFNLTGAQKKVLDIILKDLSSPYRMHRLLQGDVGCGKTVVAGLAALAVVKAGYQAAFLVPTEILALQHFDNFRKMFGIKSVNVSLLTASLSKKEKSKVYLGLKQGEIDLVIGTHALLNEKLAFKRLGFVVIDEEHRFGVEQRMALYRRDLNPDVLVMTATPIPRSLALSIYGDMDISVIDEYPQDRAFPDSFLKPQSRREEVYEFLEKEISHGRQAYVICPLIEQGAGGYGVSVEDMLLNLRRRFKKFRIDTLHSKLPAEGKNLVINKFKEGKIDILVCTSVVEVGVDIPNATCMIVENPEKFGLSQLHQLRGRIMRSNLKPYFFMIYEDNVSPDILARLKVLTESTNGFEIAEQDLRLRGPGDIFGIYQHGYLGASIVSPLEDLKTLKQARRFAFEVVKKDPYLNLPQHKGLKEYINRIMDKCILWREN